MLILLILGSIAAFLLQFLGLIPLATPLSPLSLALFVCAWLMLVVLATNMLFSRPSRITISGNNTITFRGGLRRSIFRPGDILSIRQREDDILLTHRAGALALRRRYHDQAGFFTWLKMQNPDVEIEPDLMN